LIGSFLVKAGEAQSVYVNKGDYEVYYALGKKWLGKGKQFGIFTTYYQDTADFNTYRLHQNGRSYRWTTDFTAMRKEIQKISKKDFIYQ
jgi:hypothetical protein